MDAFIGAIRAKQAMLSHQARQLGRIGRIVALAGQGQRAEPGLERRLFLSPDEQRIAEGADAIELIGACLAESEAPVPAIDDDRL